MTGSAPDDAAAFDGALVARGITVTIAGRRVVDGVDLQARRGEIVAVTGPSGSGKSTLLTVLAGLVTPGAGTVERPDGQVGVVLQGYGLLPLLTAHENVQLPLQLAGRPRAEIVRRAAQALETAGLGEDQLPRDRLAEELSGGQQQRVAVARALVVEPDLLVADEPTSELDAAAREIVLAALRALAARGAVVVLATHDPEVAELCDASIRLVDGRVVSAEHL